MTTAKEYEIDNAIRATMNRYHDAAGRCACGVSMLVTHRSSNALPGSACCPICKCVIMLKKKP